MPSGNAFDMISPSNSKCFFQSNLSCKDSCHISPVVDDVAPSTPRRCVKSRRPILGPLARTTTLLSSLVALRRRGDDPAVDGDGIPSPRARIRGVPRPCPHAHHKKKAAIHSPYGG